jgi:hypothetical protein
LYSTLYTARQHHPDYLPRAWYVDDASRLPWVRSIKIRVSDKLIKDRSRGLVIATNEETHGGLRSFDYIIIIAENLPRPYERIVTIKELMHCYFAPLPEKAKYVTGTQIALDNHFRALFGGSAVMMKSPQMAAEKMAIWMAIGVICPEHRRMELVANERAGKITPEQIADEFKIPLVTAKALIDPQFEDEVASLI